MSYSSLADLKSYLNIATAETSDDVLLQRLLDAAASRIDSRCQRTFEAASDTTRYFSPEANVMRGELYLDADLSYITSVVNGDGATLTTADYYHSPINTTPWYALGIRTSSTAYWDYTTDTQDAIAITGRWAYMHSARITAISRSSNVITATVYAPGVVVGQNVYCLGVADATFNGSFTVTAVTGTTVTWAQTAANDTDTTGTLLFCPPDIVQASRRLASWLYRQKDSQQSGIASPLFTADGTVVMPSTLPQDVEDILRPYYRLIA